LRKRKRPNRAAILHQTDADAARQQNACEGGRMLHYAVIFFLIALIAALFGFGGIAAGAAEIAKVLFFIFLVLFVVSLVVGLFRRGS
jgi:uncharacterized membrane protein YtjA (UPF0391 family)